MPGLLQLPDELLLESALGADTAGLQRLSLTCRRLRPIGQEALLRTAILPPANIWKLARTLHARDDLAKAFTHMRFGNCDKATFKRVVVEVEDQVLDATEDACNWNACCEMLVQAYPAVEEHSPEKKEDPSGVYFAVLALIAALAPSLQALTLPVDALDEINFMRNLSYDESDLVSINRSNRSQRQHQVRSLLQSRLQSLQITQLPNFDSRWLGFFDLSGFDALATFSGPFHRVRVPEPSDLSKVLPSSLKHVHFRMPSKFKSSDVAWLSIVITFLPKLKTLKLHWVKNLYSTAWDIAAAPSSGRLALRLLREWEKQLALTTTFGDKKFTDRFVDTNCTENENPGVEGSLSAAIERCLATTHDRMEQDAELLEALGYRKP